MAEREAAPAHPWAPRHLCILALQNSYPRDTVSVHLIITRHIPMPRPAGVAPRRAIWLSCQIVELNPLLRAVTLGIRAFCDTCPSLDVVPALHPLGRPSAVPNCSRQFGQPAPAPLLRGQILIQARKSEQTKIIRRTKYGYFLDIHTLMYFSELFSSYI